VAYRAVRGAITRPTGATPVAPMLLGRGRIGGDLDPEQVSRILLMADQGYLHAIVDLFDESRQKDCHLHAVCANFELGLAAAEVQVVPASSKRADRKIAARVEEVLANFGADADNALDLYGLIEHLARAYWYDHSVAELLLEKRDGQIIPFAAEPVHARRFCRSLTDGKLRFWDECGTVAWPGIDLKAEFPTRYIQFEPRVTGGGPNREGLMVLLVWAALFRNWTIRDWLMLGELAWKPWRIGYYNKQALQADRGAAGRADIAALEDALQHLVSTGATMLPDTVKLQVEFPTKTGSGGDSQHQALAMFMAAEMSKAVTGSTQTVEEGSRGTARTATTHENTTRGRSHAGLRNVAACLRRDLVTPFVRMNYGSTVKVPGLRLVADDKLDMVVLAAAVKDLVEAGAPISLQWVLKKLGAPMPKPGDLVIGNPTPEVIPMQDAAKKPKRKMPVRLAEPERLAA
jgi:phage gp29-like protein